MAQRHAMNGKTAMSRFPGWFVAWAAFAIAAFSWGVVFYRPSVFLQTLHVTRGWSVAIISSAVTVQFLLSALIITYLPDIHRSWGIAVTTTVGALLSAAGLLAWSGAWQPWQIFGAAGLGGAGWAVTSGAALNAMIAPWFEREWPKALSLAFNGARVGGIVFVPLWIALIAQFGFLTAAILIGSTMIFIIAGLAYCFLRHDPSHYGLNPDGDVVRSVHKETAPARPRAVKPFRLASGVRPARYLLIRNRVVAVAGGSQAGSERSLSETQMPAASKSRSPTPMGIGNTSGQPQQISAPNIALAVASRAKRIWRGSARCSRRASNRRCCFLSRWMATPVAPSFGRSRPYHDGSTRQSCLICAHGIAQ
jgi:MFS family permease